MEVESLRQEISKLKTESAGLKVKSKLFENFAAMAHSCCRRPSTVEWNTIKETIQTTLEFSIELTGAEKGHLVLFDRNGKVTNLILPLDRTSKDKSAEAADSALNPGLSSWVKNHHQIGLIRDTNNDDRWHAPSKQPHTVRSVLAVPILKSDELLGILTLEHSQANHFSLDSMDQMQATSDQIAMTIENNRLYGRLDESYRSLDRSKQEIEAYSKALDEELEKGKEIQRDFLPNQIPQIPNWEIATYFAPAKQVSGDFYDVFSLPGENLGIVIADVADKGVGSALYMALIRSLIRVFSGHISLHGFANFSTNIKIPDTLSEHSATADQINALNAVKLTNDYIAHEHGKEGMFATIFFGVINPSNGIMAYINAGHEPVFIVDSSGEQRSLEPTGPAVGMLLDMKFETQQVQVKPDDIILGYTDGVIEALAPNGDFFTRKRLLSIVKQRPASAPALVERIKTNLVTHVHNAPPSDDITMLAVRRISLN